MQSVSIRIFLCISIHSISIGVPSVLGMFKVPVDLLEIKNDSFEFNSSGF